MSIDARLIACYVLLVKQASVLDYAITIRAPSVLRATEKAIETKVQTTQDVIAVYELALSLVDNIVRFEKIAASLPRFSQKSLEYRAFANALSGFKDLRNLLQHVNGDIENNYESPLLGGVTWANEDTNFMVAMHDLGGKKSVPGLIRDTVKGEFLSQFCYVHNNKYYDINRASAACISYLKYVQSNCQVIVNGNPYDLKNHYAAIAVSYLKTTPVKQIDVPGRE